MKFHYYSETNSNYQRLFSLGSHLCSHCWSSANWFQHLCMWGTHGKARWIWKTKRRWEFVNTIVEGISEFHTKCKALILVKLKQQSRFSYKKFFQHLNQQCKSDFRWIPTVKWPLYKFLIRHWNHQVKEAFKVNSFIEISIKLRWLVLYARYQTAVLRPSHIYCDNRWSMFSTMIIDFLVRE